MSLGEALFCITQSKAPFKYLFRRIPESFNSQSALSETILAIYFDQLKKKQPNVKPVIFQRLFSTAKTPGQAQTLLQMASKVGALGYAFVQESALFSAESFIYQHYNPLDKTIKNRARMVKMLANWKTQMEKGSMLCPKAHQILLKAFSYCHSGDNAFLHYQKISKEHLRNIDHRRVLWALAFHQNSGHMEGSWQKKSSVNIRKILGNIQGLTVPVSRALIAACARAKDPKLIDVLLARQDFCCLLNDNQLVARWFCQSLSWNIPYLRHLYLTSYSHCNFAPKLVWGSLSSLRNRKDLELYLPALLSDAIALKMPFDSRFLDLLSDTINRIWRLEGGKWSSFNSLEHLGFQRQDLHSPSLLGTARRASLKGLYTLLEIAQNEAQSEMQIETYLKTIESL